MLKVSSSALLLTAFVFSSAHAPTFQLWRNLPATDDSALDAQTTAAFDTHPNAFAYAHYALSGEYDEDNDLERFELDELFLPQLDVTLPELFDWSDGDRIYLASNTPPLTYGFGLDSSGGFAFHNSTASGGFGAGSSGHASGGGSAINTKSASAAEGAESDDSDQDDFVESLPTDDRSAPDPTPSTFAAVPQGPDDQFKKNDADPPSDLLPMPILDPELHALADTEKPVQVPTPAPLGLFALGLAALRFVGRKKNGSG